MLVFELTASCASEILALPLYKGKPHQAFISDALKALTLCTNLQDFVCAPHILPSFLDVLASRTRLKDIRVNANLTAEQAEVLIRVRGLQKLVLDHATGWVMHVLPSWAGAMSDSLSHLAITVGFRLDLPS